MKINHAILHILDFDSAVNVMSQRELDIESRTVRDFVTTHLRRARTSADNKRATFAENSAFGGELKGYFFGEREFVDLSQQIAEFISSELTKAEKAESTDVLVADFDDDEDARWFAVMLLGSKQAFMHEVGREEGEVRNDIARHYAILPNPSQKVPSYAIVRASTMEIGYVDKKRKIAGEDRMLIPDGLLQCDTGVSGKEIIDTVTRVVEEPVIKESVRAALTEEKVPERVPVERKQVERAAVRNHKIRTDTGIEISFPAEMGSNSEYIEFVNEPNGLISIELKNIGSIENR